MQTEQPFRHTPDMGEISGFGSSYEDCCQDMLEAGVRWLNEHGEAKGNLTGKTIKNVTGIFMAESNEAKALEAAIMSPASVETYGATGAMHQAVMQRLFYISANGWDDYCAEVRKHNAEQAA